MEKSFLVSVFAVFLVLALISVVSADIGDLTKWWKVTINGVEYVDGDTIGIEAGEIVPIKIVFEAEKDASDVRVKAWIDGYRADISDKTGRFELVEDSIYTKHLSLEVPSDIDPTEDYTLIIRISDKTESDEYEFPLKLQRESYNLAILSAELPEKVTTGSVVAIEVVLKNRGMHELEDIYVKARISDLGIEKKVYFGDLDPLDECEYEYDETNDIIIVSDCNRDDSVERRIYLPIPDNAKAGVYALEVEAYNVDSTDLVKKNIIVSGVEEITAILPGTIVKSLRVGEEVSYDLVIINSGSKMRVYTLRAEEAKGLIVKVEPIVTVPAESSKTVKVRVKATESVEEGTHIVGINVESDSELVKQVSFTANVEKARIRRPSSVFVLTVVLVIVFVVLLIVLIVLLTKKPAPVGAAEGEETSYY